MTSKNVGETLGEAVGKALREALKNASEAEPKKKLSPLSGMKGVAAGAGLAALAPLAKKGVDAVRNGSIPGGLMSRAAGKAGDRVKDGLSKKIDEAGGAGAIAKEAAKGVLPGIGGDGGGEEGMPGVGEGRRMPVQQAIDVAVPLETAYNQFTQFEDWPKFMHRVTQVRQEDECTVSFSTKIWGKSKAFTAEIETQRPEQRIKWRVVDGISHSGVASFHELAPTLTRVEVSLDVDPGSLIEKAARGMRHIKRAVRSDLARYKAYIEMQELETGAWRGVIEEGELVEEHDDSYDDERDYSDVDDLYGEDEDEDEDDDSDEGGSRSGRFERGSGSKSKSKSKGSTTKSKGSKTKAKSSSNSKRSSSGKRSGGGGKRKASSRS